MTRGGRLAVNSVASARRMADIAPFHVMALLARAKALEAACFQTLALTQRCITGLKHHHICLLYTSRCV